MRFVVAPPFFLAIEIKHARDEGEVDDMFLYVPQRGRQFLVFVSCRLAREMASVRLAGRSLPRSFLPCPSVPFIL